MKNILLTIIALLLAGSLGFGIYVYFDTRDNAKESESSKGIHKNSKNDKSSNQDIKKDERESYEEKPTTTPEMVDVLRMIDAGKNVDGIVDQEGNTWKQNQDIAVSYTNPQGQSYSSSLTYDGEIDGTDFVPAYDEDETPEGIFAEEPDQDIIDELQEEIDNAGLQTEMETKQKELDDYINSFN
ncbi:hypothetical protein AABD41_01250 [Staphylococcus pseudoxylosus]|uniref:hypothetical protein n=1 Tax=Staphylococcus pseudoxylosus TaxID=2282419 RepID=UPI00398A55C3